MADTSDNRSAAKKSTPRRGGLGRGLGSLIPPSQSEESVNRPNPMDLLVPDLRHDAGDKRETRVRGGSARDLLSPRSKSGRSPEPIVSRETITSSDAAGNDEANVSRETIARERRERAQTDPSGQPDRGTQDVARAQDRDSRAHSPIVSRETITAEPADSGQVDLVVVPGATFGMISTSQIIPNTKQPRQIFEEREILELSESLREVGFLQPIVVRPIVLDQDSPAELISAVESNPEARYELIMGERRLRAAEMGEIESVPAIVRETADDDLLRDALLENLHRVQLNPLEEAAAYAQLMEDFKCTQETLSSRIARSRSQIANTLRLLRLPSSVQQHVAAGTISAGHARAVLALSDQELMQQVADRIIEEGLSVRATEEIVRQLKNGPTAVPVRRTPAPPSQLALTMSSRFADLLDTRVSIREGERRGRIIIDFADEDDLRRIAAILGRD